MKTAVSVLVSALISLSLAACTVVPRNAETLFWTQAQREAGFGRLAELTPHRAIEASRTPLPLPAGRPLDVDAATLMATGHVAGVLVLQDGRIRMERYGLGLTAHRPWASFSVTKSVTATLVGAAIQDGYIRSVDTPVIELIPELRATAYEGVTLRHLLTMSSGVAWNEDYDDRASDVGRLVDDIDDPDASSTIERMSKLPRAVPPGTRWLYNTGDTELLGLALKRAIGRPLADYLAEKIWIPFGMEDGADWMLDAQGNERGGCCISASLRDWGRFGLFMLAGGVVAGEPVLPEGWVNEATTSNLPPGPLGNGYGYLWWTKPGGAYEAMGVFGQRIHIDPSRRLVIVILSAAPTAAGGTPGAPRNSFVASVAAALDLEASTATARPSTNDF